MLARDSLGTHCSMPDGCKIATHGQVKSEHRMHDVATKVHTSRHDRLQNSIHFRCDHQSWLGYSLRQRSLGLPVQISRIVPNEELGRQMMSSDQMASRNHTNHCRLPKKPLFANAATYTSNSSSVNILLLRIMRLLTQSISPREIDHLRTLTLEQP